MKLSLYLVVLATIFIHAKAAPEVNFDAQESVQRSSGQHEWEHNGAGDGSETISESALSHESAKIGDGSSNGSGMAANSKKSGSCRGTGGMSVSVCKSRKESVEGQGERNGIRTVTIDISGSQVADRGSCSGNAGVRVEIILLGSRRSKSAVKAEDVQEEVSEQEELQEEVQEEVREEVEEEVQEFEEEVREVEKEVQEVEKEVQKEIQEEVQEKDFVKEKVQEKASVKEEVQEEVKEEGEIAV